MTAAGQRGGALIAALGVLSAMTLLATMSLLAGGADLALSTRRARQRASFYAAESALETTLAELAGAGSPIPAATFREPWPAPGVGIRDWRDGPWDCSRRICLLPDANDADGDPSTPVVLFNRDFGHHASPVQHGGHPLVQVLVAVRSGESRETIAAEIAPVTLSPRTDAGWRTGGDLALRGDIRVFGTATLPALAGGGTVRLLDGAVIEGECLTDAHQPPPVNLLSLLNAGGTLSSLDELSEPPAAGSVNGLFWARGDFNGPLDGQGVLVVHNPAFDPVKHEASRVAIEEGRLVEGLDPAYSHLDPSRQPARLGIAGGGSFSGLVVADTIGSFTTGFTLTGALVTLTRSPLIVAASAPLRISASPAAVERAGRGPLRFVASFRPVAAGPGSLGPCP